MKIIGVTGNSGAGKSEVCKMLKIKYNAYIIDADEIARSITILNKECIDEIVKNFGEDILDINGNIKRGKLAKIIYNNKNKREKLNSITFKYITEQVNIELEKAKKENFDYAIIDAPLLFEADIAKKCNIVIGIISKKDIKIARISNRDSITIEDANSRLKAQKSNKFFKENCNYIIENNYNTLEKLEEEVNNISI